MAKKNDKVEKHKIKRETSDSKTIRTMINNDLTVEKTPVRKTNVKKILKNDNDLEIEVQKKKENIDKNTSKEKGVVNNQKNKKSVNKSNSVIDSRKKGNQKKLNNINENTSERKSVVDNSKKINQKNNNGKRNSNNEPELVKKNLKKKRKLKRKFKILLLILLIMLIMFLIGVGINIFLKYQKKVENDRIAKERNEIVNKIQSHYNNYVKVNKDTKLYRIDENSNYYEYGIVYEGVEIALDEIDINYLTEYFYSSSLQAYIKFDDLVPIDELSKHDNRYKNYIVFNQNVVTKDNFSLYDDDKKIYTFNASMTFPIIIKNDNGKYYVEYNNRLLYILNEDISKIVNANNTKTTNASKVTTLCYHRIYDSSHKCNDLYICKSKNNFEREMKYLSDNKFFTLTMREMYLYLTKKIQIPRKSVVLTFDDGTLFELGINILEKYNLHGTGFIKTGTFSDYSVYESPNFELQSHTDKMHVAGTCKRETSVQQGGGILCLPESTVLNDLKLSREKLDGAIALAYPFYDYNNRAIRLVEKAGFKLAFIGANNVSGRSYPGINLYKVPRMTIWNTTSFETFKGYVNN